MDRGRTGIEGGIVRRHQRIGVNQLGLAVGGLGAIGAGLVLVPFRREIDNANLALILVLVVVIAAIVGGRGAGALAAVTATLSFDFFLTRPYLSMRIDSADDMETMLVLLAVGLLVGQVASRGRRSRRRREEAVEAIARVHRAGEQVALGHGVDDVVRVVRVELIQLLRLQDCWLEFPPFTWVAPRLERGGTIDATEHGWGPDGFALSADGIQLPVLTRGREVARLVLIGDPSSPVGIEERVVAVALADQLGSALALARPEELARLADKTHEDD